MSEHLQLAGIIMKLIYDQALESLSLNEVKTLFSFLKKKDVINGINIELSETLINDLTEKAKKIEFDSEWEFFEILEEFNPKD